MRSSGSPFPSPPLGEDEDGAPSVPCRRGSLEKTLLVAIVSFSSFRDLRRAPGATGSTSPVAAPRGSGDGLALTPFSSAPSSFSARSKSRSEPPFAGDDDARSFLPNGNCKRAPLFERPLFRRERKPFVRLASPTGPVAGPFSTLPPEEGRTVALGTSRTSGTSGTSTLCAARPLVPGRAPRRRRTAEGSPDDAGRGGGVRSRSVAGETPPPTGGGRSAGGVSLWLPDARPAAREKRPRRPAADGPRGGFLSGQRTAGRQRETPPPTGGGRSAGGVSLWLPNARPAARYARSWDPSAGGGRRRVQVPGTSSQP
jgi:hypothetical protein